MQEAVVVLKDCFRRYPGRYEGIIATLCENLDSLDESQAKAAMIWIIGEYRFAVCCWVFLVSQVAQRPH